MTGMRVLLVDHHHLSSRLAAAYFKKHAPATIRAESAGFDPLPFSKEWADLFRDLGLPLEENTSVSLETIKGAHFDLTIGIGLDAVATCPLPPGGLVRVNWDLRAPESSDLAHLIGHASRIEAAVKHFFSDGYFDALLTRLACFENIFDSLNEGIMAHDLDRKIFYFSRGAEKITGSPKESVLGKDCHSIFSPRICNENCVFCEGCDNPDVRPSSFTTPFTTADGMRKELMVTRFPMKDEKGHIIGAILTYHDVTRLRELEEKLGEAQSFSGIIGRDHSMLTVFELIRDIAVSDFPVVVTGESGTGKELVAAAIHSESGRRDKLFVPVNCGALPEGIIESELFGHVKGSFTGAIRDKKGRFDLADKGTLFLDEIAELSPRMQVKLLRVLQEGEFEPVGSEQPKKVDVRLICATNRDLKELVRTGAFRDDLYYRLAVMPIHLPPLRERRNDIDLLTRHFIEKNAGKLSLRGIGITDDALFMLMNYNWPGNVRQLQNCIQFALIKCRGSTILPEHLPPEITSATARPSPDLKGAGKAGRKPKLTAVDVEQALVKSGGNKAKAARLLSVGRATLYHFLDEHRKFTTAGK